MKEYIKIDDKNMKIRVTEPVDTTYNIDDLKMEYLRALNQINQTNAELKMFDDLIKEAKKLGIE